MGYLDIMRIVHSITITAILLISLLCIPAGAYQLNQQAPGSGGGPISDGIYTLDVQVGQIASGASCSSDGLMWDGFWGMYTSTPALLAKPRAVESIADGVFVCIAGAAASTSSSDLAECIYVQDTDRISGIRVSFMNSIPSISRGSNVNIIGNIATTPSGERVISNSVVFVTSPGSPPGPLGMRNREIGRSGISNTGLLVHCWGNVIDKGTDFFVISDGSGADIRVDASKLTSIPDHDQYVSVTGISSTYISGNTALPVVIARDDNDITIHHQ